MTKQELAKIIIEHIDNSAFMGEDPLPGLMIYLEHLVPKHPEHFCLIGYKHQQSTEEECWL